PKILLLDDKSYRASLLGDALAPTGWELTLVENAWQCIEKAEAGEVDLIVMILDSHEESGWKTVDEITEAAPFLPVVVITNPDLKELAEAVGAHAWIERPINVTALVRMMQECMNQRITKRYHASPDGKMGSKRHSTKADDFGEILYQRATIPYAFARPQRHWGINE
ncbi:MAG TPA: response regulator, partial [Verrucomicrobiae bacterium]|nr:response regulator [Verrucomicrobiae bacterium]